MLSVRRVDRSDKGQTARLLSLLRHYDPELGQAETTAMIEASCGSAIGGVIAICAPNNTIRGVFFYRLPLGGRSALAVSHVLIPPLGRQLVARHIALAITELAALGQCRDVSIALQPGASWEIAFFAAQGYEISVSGGPPGIADAAVK